MGKKSKRRGGKRSQPNQLKVVEPGHSNAIEKFQRIRLDVDALWNEGVDLANSGFRSNARCNFSEIFALLMSEKEMLMEDHFQYYCHTLVTVSSILLQVEYQERHFDNMMFLYESTLETFGKVPFPSTSLYYNLARMVTGKLDASSESLAFLKYTRTKEDILEIGPAWNHYIFELCHLKKWTTALDLNKRVGPALDRGTDWSNSHLIRATIYIERYRVEASKGPKSERNKMSLSLHKYISIEICKAWKRKKHIANGYTIFNTFFWFKPSGCTSIDTEPLFLRQSSTIL